MNRQTRRNFFTCVAGGAAGLLVGSLEEWVPGCCPLKPLLTKDMCYLPIRDTHYKVIRVNTPHRGMEFTTTTEKGHEIDSSCPIVGHDLERLVKFEESVRDDPEVAPNGYQYRYLLVNSKEEYGMLASERPCYNFKPYSK